MRKVTDETEPVTLERVLAEIRGQSDALYRVGQDVVATYVRRIVDDVEAAAEPYLKWLSETEARLQSGHGVAWFRARRNQWQADGHARKGPKGWQYRAVIVPSRPNRLAALEAGRRAGESAA